MSLKVTIIISGSRDALAACRSRLNELLSDEFDGKYREFHVPGRLEYRLTVASGIPFPPFVTVSTEFPDLAFDFQWQGTAGESGGSATITAGRLAEQVATDASAMQGGGIVHIGVDLQGVIRIAMIANRLESGRVIGYAASDARHCYFELRTGSDATAGLLVTDGIAGVWRWCLDGGGQSAPTQRPATEPSAIDLDTVNALDELSTRFATAWLWFDAEPEVDTAVERHRYAAQGLVVRPANVQSARFRDLEPVAGGMRQHSTLPADLTTMANVLERYLAGVGTDGAVGANDPINAD